MRSSMWIRMMSVIALMAFLNGAAAQVSELPNRADPLDNLTTSGQPNAEALKKLAGSGYSAVIDLRGVDENRGFDERSVVEGSGMAYFSLPVEGARDISFENADALDRLLSGIEGRVLLHCGSGNRAGALLALRAKMQGADNETALALGREAGLTSLEPTVKERLASDRSSSKVTN